MRSDGSYIKTYHQQTGKDLMEEVKQTVNKAIPDILEYSAITLFPKEWSFEIIVPEMWACYGKHIITALNKRMKDEWCKYRIPSLQYLCQQRIKISSGTKIAKYLKMNSKIITSILRLSGIEKDKREGIVKTLENLRVCSNKYL